MQGADSEETWVWWNLPVRGFVGTEGEEKAVQRWRRRSLGKAVVGEAMDARKRAHCRGGKLRTNQDGVCCQDWKYKPGYLYGCEVRSNLFYSNVHKYHLEISTCSAQAPWIWWNFVNCPKCHVCRKWVVIQIRKWWRGTYCLKKPEEEEMTIFERHFERNCAVLTFCAVSCIISF